MAGTNTHTLELGVVPQTGAHYQSPLVALVPLDVQMHILDHLTSAADLARAAASCSQWHRLILNETWPDIERMHAFHCKDLKKALWWAAVHCPNLAELDLSLAGRIQLASLLPMRRMSLEVLTLPHLWRPFAANDLLCYLPRTLRVLEMPGLMLDVHSLTMLRTCFCLRTLHASYKGWSWTGLPGLQRLTLEPEDKLQDLEIDQSLEYLCAHGCYNLKLSRPYDSGRVADTIPLQTNSPGFRLKEVDISGTAVGICCLEWMAASCPLLESVNFNSCRNVEGLALLVFLSASKALQNGRLRSIRVADLTTLTSDIDDIFEMLCSFHRGGLPLSLDLSSCGDLREHHLCAIVHKGGDAFRGQPTDQSVSSNDKSQSADVVRLGQLWLAGSRATTTESLKSLASGGAFGGLSLLDLSHADCMSPKVTAKGGLPDCLEPILFAAGPSLQVLLLDGAKLPSSHIVAIGENCPKLQRLSLIGVKGITEEGLHSIATGCAELDSLSLGGSNPDWTHSVGLAAFSGLTELCLSRRTELTDTVLLLVLERHPQLRRLTLSMCSRLTDRSLMCLPERLQELLLVCCQAVKGSALSRLRALQVLKLPGCTGITEDAVEAVARKCKALRLLELPSSLPNNSLKRQSQGDLAGLKVEGGKNDGSKI